jgi:16S rRNA (adenine1518-N6/adenine1519-N6)-dimethyltransferase
MAQIKGTQSARSISRASLINSGVRAKKSLGQHFLDDPAIIDNIIDKANFGKNDIVVEIGSGLGALTIPVLPYIHHLIAVEKDPVLIDIVKERLSLDLQEKLTFVPGDVLKLDIKEIFDRFKRKIRILGNLPYNISSPILEKLIFNRNYIKNAILMFQYELAQRLVAAPGNKDYGALSVICQYYARLSPLIKVGKNSFYPKPKVDSMVLEIDFEKPYPYQVKNEDFFHKIIKAAFSCRRKTILNSLERGLKYSPRETIAEALKDSMIDPKQRAETLTIEDYIKLTSALISDRAIT